MVKVGLTIRGMNCAHCVMAVRKELARVDGVTVGDVQIGKAVVQYDETKVTSRQLEDAVKKAGYILDAVRQAG